MTEAEKSLTDLAALPGEGRTLDAMIAKKIFRTRVECSDHPSDRGEFYDLDQMRPGDNWPTVEIPRYSTDISDAWKVVEKLASQQLLVLLTIGYGASCRIETGSGAMVTDAQADHAPLAICRAALKAFASRVPENKEGK